MTTPLVELTPKQKELSDLFDKEEAEQVYQSFLEQNTCFLPREFIQNHGIRNNLVISKLKLGADLVTDFAYLAASSDDFNIVLVELEKPHSKFFKPGLAVGDAAGSPWRVEQA